jgi:hypothetical protein
MMITATIDRFKGGVLVHLVGNEETVVNIYRSYLPSEAKQGDLLRLEVVVFVRPSISSAPRQSEVLGGVGLGGLRVSVPPQQRGRIRLFKSWFLNH